MSNTLITLDNPADIPAYLDPKAYTSIETDSRQVKPGCIFIAYPGLSFDRHGAIPDAVARGARAIVMERPYDLPETVQGYLVSSARQAWAYLYAALYDYPGRKLTVIGVTGTDGKTSTSNLIFHILQAAGPKVSMISTVNAIIGDQIMDTGLHVTTPDPPDVQRYLAQMVEAGTEICILETTSHALEQFRIDGSDVDLAVVTNITHEHLDIHGNSLENYRLAKARLFKMAGRKAILNADDWSYQFLCDQIGGCIPSLSYSLESPADLQARAIRLQPDATRFDVVLQGQTYTVESPLVGAFNVSNILAALAVTVLELGIAPEIALQALRQFPGVPGRMERITVGNPDQDFTAIVDFAHTPNALRRALETAQALVEWAGRGRVIAIFGCAGLRDLEKRVMMGQVAAELADITIITAEDPRTEDLDAIINSTAQAMLAQGAVEVPYQTDPSPQLTAISGPAFIRVLDRGQALYHGVSLAQPGDIVLALGKGHEQSMCFGTTEYSWDDREAMRAALRGKPLATLPTAKIGSTD